MIQCSCPECSYRYKVADELAGKSVLCPECQTRFKVKGTSRAVGVEPCGRAAFLGRGFAIRMPYVEQSLLPGEQVVHCCHVHWAVFVRGTVHFLLGVMFFSLAMIFDDRKELGTINVLLYSTGVALLISAFLALLAALIRRMTTELAVTDQRVITKVGWIRRRTLEMNVAKVENIQVAQSILGRLLAYGTITVVGTGGTREPFPHIADPLEFRKAVQAQSH